VYIDHNIDNDLPLAQWGSMHDDHNIDHYYDNDLPLAQWGSMHDDHYYDNDLPLAQWGSMHDDHYYDNQMHNNRHGSRALLDNHPLVQANLRDRRLVHRQVHGSRQRRPP
jgi:hypothetical protein